MQIAHYSRLSVRRYTYPYTIFNGLSGKAVAKRPHARFSCCTMTTNLGETFRLALAALRSTVGDAKFREIEKTWVQEHQEQFDPTGLKITATYSDKSTKAIDPTDEAVTYHYDFAKPSGAAKITVTYDGQTASFTVKVTADAGNKTGNNPKQQASPVQNGNTSTQPNGVSNPLSKTGASTAPIIALAALALLTGGVNADPYGCSPHGCAGSARCGATPWPCSPHR